MKKCFIRFSSVILLLTMVFSLSVSAITKSPDPASPEVSANKLYNLGLVRGTGDGFDFNSRATRLHGVIMLLRLMGEEDAALNCNYTCPFQDVTGYGKPYLAYAYEKGYANGTSAEEPLFSPNKEIDFRSYVTFLLRVLGYDDANGDFTWSKCVSKASEIGMIDLTSAKYIEANKPTFYRSDMFDLSLSALTMNMKGKSMTLAEELIRRGVFSEEDGIKQGVLKAGKIVYYHDPSTVTRTTNAYTVPSGTVTADVITVNTMSPKVSVKACMVDNTLGATKTFSDIVSESGAQVVINGNFFGAYDEFKFPIGMIMSDGKFLYGGETLPQFGFTPGGDIQTGSPSIVFTATSGKYAWTCFQLNMKITQYTYGVVYTSAFGPNVTLPEGGVVTLVSNDTIQDTYTANSGDVIPIPANGYMIYFGPSFTSTDYYRSPVKGEKITLAPTFFRSNDDGFSLTGVEQIVSGAPCLVDNGEICTILPAGFQETRFTTAITPRTALGKLSDGKLIIVSTSSASIQQMRELMLQLGCVEAINLDGGGSTALAYEGKIIRSPGRKLTTTLHIFVNN